MGLPIVDRAAIANQRILSSLQYGAYSCVHQQKHLRDTEDLVRGSIFGYGSGGYIKGAHLPAHMGGLGLRDTRRHMAIETMGILERSLARKSLAAEIVVTYRVNVRSERWPAPLISAFAGLDHPSTFKRSKKADPAEDMNRRTPLFSCDLHDDLLPHLRHHSQDGKAQIDFEFNEGPLEDGRKTQEMHAIVRSTNGSDIAYWTKRRGCSATDRLILLAQVVSRERANAREVTLAHPLPPDLEAIVSLFRDDPKSNRRPHRVYLSVIARTRTFRIIELSGVVAHAMPRKPSEDDHVPDAYPLSVRNRGAQNFVTGNLHTDVSGALDSTQGAEYLSCRQIAELLADTPTNLHLSSATAGTMHGVHYDSTLPGKAANELLGLRTGVILKGNKEFCRLCPTIRLSLAHICTHVGPGEIEHVLAEADTSSAYGPVIRAHAIHGSLAFGFVTSDMYRRIHPNEEKAFVRHMRKLSASLSTIGTRWYAACSTFQRAPDLTPVFDIVLATQESRKRKYQGFADASLVPGKNGAKARMGIGGHVNEGDRVIFKFSLGRNVPNGVSSTLAEHLAGLLLAKVINWLEIQDVCALADNNAIPNQVTGLWSTNTWPFVLVRQETQALLSNVDHAYLWLSRVYNTYADQLAKEGAQGVTTPHPPELEAEFNAVLQRVTEYIENGGVV